MSDKVTTGDVEVNCLFMMSQAMDLILRDVDSRMRQMAAKEGKSGGFRHEKKMLFRKYAEAVRAACVMSEMLNADIVALEEKKGFRDYDLWLRESNELARLILLYADKSSEDGATEAIFGYLNSFKGAGVVSEDDLRRFFLK